MRQARTLDVTNERHRGFLLRHIEAQELPFRAEVGPIPKKRSGAANDRLWALHRMAGNHLGYSAEEMHEHALCHHYGYTEHEVMDPLTGELVKKRIPKQRSSDKEPKEFAELLEATEVWYGEEFGCWLSALEVA